MIRKDLEFNFNFPEGNKENSELIDFIDLKDFNSNLFLSESEKRVILEYLPNNKVKVLNMCSKGYLIAEYGDGINVGWFNSKTRRGRVIKKMVGALNTGKHFAILLENHFIRKISDKETFLLQGFDKKDYYKCKKVVNKELYFNSGNSIPVTILESIFKKINLEI